MKTITTTINIYEYDELTTEAKERAIKDHIDFLLEVDWANEEYTPDYVEEALKKADELRTPWFLGSFIYEYGKEIIEQELKDHDYLITGEVFIQDN